MWPAENGLTGILSTSMAHGPVFSLSLAAEICCKKTGAYYTWLYPALILLSWMKGPGFIAIGTGESILGRAVAGKVRRLIS